jgi:hypothetical protein
MTAYMVIAIPSVKKDPAHDIILHRMPIDYGDAETVNEKEIVYGRMIEWLLAYVLSRNLVRRRPPPDLH